MVLSKLESSKESSDGAAKRSDKSSSGSLTSVPDRATSNDTCSCLAGISWCSILNADCSRALDSEANTG